MTSSTVQWEAEASAGTAEGQLARLWKSAAGGDSSAWIALVEAWAPEIWCLIREADGEGLNREEVSKLVWLRLADSLTSWVPRDEKALRDWLGAAVCQEIGRARWTRDSRLAGWSDGREGPADVVDLVSRAGAGDSAAWEALVNRYVGLIWAITRSFRLGHDDASDVAQTTWLRLVENLSRLNEPARVGAWLATTARRECIRVLARGKRDVLVADDGCLDLIDLNQPPVDHRLVSEENVAEVQRAFAKLPVRSQELLSLLMLDPPLSYAEISAALGVPIGSIGPTRGRSLGKLRTLIESEREEGPESEGASPAAFARA